MDRILDGVHFDIDDRPALTAADGYEAFGIEDPRITGIDDTYYINYVAVAASGVTTCLASTRDFKSFRRHGVIFHPENKDVVILPQRIGGQYYALHRPHSPLFRKNDIWIAESPDLLCWGRHRHLMGLRDGSWDETRIGAGAVPFRIDEGWLEIYHGADRNSRYCLGAVLFDGEKPWEILARSKRPIFEPQAEYERAGFFGHVVFSCGLLFEDDMLKIYYGAADTVTCYAELPLSDVRAALKA
ncbi:MAG: glycoside hydrolase family 130 protein [Phycisphaerales bacterium]|nr:MAG: glycoside hydrolase family 130 protein [Phycisphaerales bacterium]